MCLLAGKPLVGGHAGWQACGHGGPPVTHARGMCRPWGAADGAATGHTGAATGQKREAGGMVMN